MRKSATINVCIVTMQRQHQVISPNTSRQCMRKSKTKKCLHCDFTTAYSHHLSRHIKAVHEKIRDKKCDYTTAHSHHLSSHIKAVHENFGNKKCPHCDYSAAESGALYKHLKAVHNKTRVKK
jgi:hypothetical protein